MGSRELCVHRTNGFSEAILFNANGINTFNMTNFVSYGTTGSINTVANLLNSRALCSIIVGCNGAIQPGKEPIDPV